jgi:hypothetical protein
VVSSKQRRFTYISPNVKIYIYFFFGKVGVAEKIACGGANLWVAKQVME